MNESQERREELLRMSRQKWRKGSIPAVHPRYQHVYRDYMENILQKKMAEAVSLRGCLSVSLSLGCLWRQIIQERKSGNIRPHRSCHRLSINRIL